MADNRGRSLSERYVQSRSFRGRVYTSRYIDGKGSSHRESEDGDTRVRLARFGFVTPVLGECAWTARDLL